MAMTLGVGAAALALAHRVLRLQVASGRASLITQQLVMLALTVVIAVALVLSLPIEAASKGQLLSLFGLVLSAAIALSSTTFLGNAIAGLMIRALASFHPGDFIRVGEHFGRVSERGLLHVQIQSEDRDLITVPNMHVVSNPVKVVRRSGTVVSADVSLSYDLDRVRVERLLCGAAEVAGLTDSFVRVTALLDHAVAYRVSGFLADVKALITARSRLHAEMLDALHGDGVEIVSPSFMNQRRLAPEQRFLFDPGERAAAPGATQAAPEELLFDKAESAAVRENLRLLHERLGARRERLSEARKQAGAADGERIEREIARIDGQLERVGRALAEEPEADD